MINETALNKIINSISQGNCCRVLGPRFHGKSKIMRKAREVLADSQGYATSYQSLLDLQYSSEENFFTRLYEKIASDTLEKHFEVIFPAPTSPFEFQFAISELVKNNERNLVVFIDDIEVSPPNLIASLLGALRAIFTMMVDQPGVNFQAVICGSISLNEVALDNASRFESISDLVIVGDLGEKVCVDFLQQRWKRSGFTPTKKGLAYFYHQTGGDLFLIESLSKFCIETMKRSNKKRVTSARVEEAVATFLEGMPNQKFKETIQQISNNPNLLLSTLKILNQGKALYSELPIEVDQTPSALDLCGVFKKEGNGYQIKSVLWSNILIQCLTPQHVGRHFSIAGNWERSIHYFGEAIRAGHSEVVSEIIATVINAVNSINLKSAEQIITKAFEFLAQGIEAAYPASELSLYHVTDSHLDLLYPLKQNNRRFCFELTDRNIPEVQALSGPRYSFTTTSIGNCFQIPLRSDINSRPIGLMVFRDFTKHSSHFSQREMIIQITVFISEVTKTIEGKLRFADLLQKLDHEAENREKIRNIATGLIHDINSTVANIPDLVDEIEELLRNGDDPSIPLANLRNLAFETDRVSKNLKDVVIKRDFETGFIDLESLIKRAIASYKIRSVDAAISYSMNGIQTEVNVADLWIELLLKNLFSNAFDAMPEGKSGSVAINVKTTQEYLIIQVIDNGVGISPEMSDKIFDFGVSTKNDHHQMRGVGLYQCQQIAENHNGKLSVESELNVGSTFTLQLPLSITSLHSLQKH